MDSRTEGRVSSAHYPNAVHNAILQVLQDLLPTIAYAADYSADLLMLRASDATMTARYQLTSQIILFSNYNNIYFWDTLILEMLYLVCYSVNAVFDNKITNFLGDLTNTSAKIKTRPLMSPSCSVLLFAIFYKIFFGS